MPPADIVVDADVASCPKNSNSVVRARLVTVRGRPCGDLRIFVGPESQTATRMGICIARRLLPELRRVVDALCEAAGEQAPSEGAGDDDDFWTEPPADDGFALGV